MLGEKIHDFLYGYVKFAVKEGFPDFFLSECKRQRINIEDIRNEEHGVIARVRFKDYPRVLNAAEITGMKAQALKRSGLPHIIHCCKKRLGIPIGIIAAILTVAFLSSCIWSIELSGNEKISDETIVKVLSELGIKRGAFIENIDTKQIEKAVENRLDGVLWIAVNIIGSRIYVDIRETVDTPQMTDDRKYVNIVASEDGEIVSADILEGDGALLPGTPVVKGDLLVSGVVTLSGGGVRFVHAKANIKARTLNTFVSSTALNPVARKIEKHSDRYSLYIFGLKLPLGVKSGGECTANEYFLNTAETIIPIGLVRERYSSFDERSIELSIDEASLICFSDFTVGALRKFENCEVVSRKMFLDCDKQITIGAEYVCIKEIGAEQEFSVAAE